MIKAEIRKYSEVAQTFITKQSKKHNGDDEINYPYSFGYSLSETSSLLQHLELNKRQLKVLKEWTAQLEAEIIV
jgi:hypothetical protein